VIFNLTDVYEFAVLAPKPFKYDTFRTGLGALSCNVIGFQNVHA
jgi:hypothetical protein